jgi:hypothetical protein
MLAPGLLFSKHKQTAENRKALSIQVLNSFGREVCSLRAGCRILQIFESRALLGDPFCSPQGMESLVQSLSQGKEMADIRGGVVESLGGEGAPPPVSSLKPLALRDSYAQQVFDESCQPEPDRTGKVGSDAGIVQVADTESAMHVQAADILVRGMNDFDDRSICQDFFERSKILQNDRVDHVDFVGGGDLNQAELLGIIAEAIGLGIEGDDPGAEHRLDSSVKLGGLADDFDGKR